MFSTNDGRTEELARALQDRLQVQGSRQQQHETPGSSDQAAELEQLLGKAAAAPETESASASATARWVSQLQQGAAGEAQGPNKVVALSIRGPRPDSCQPSTAAAADDHLVRLLALPQQCSFAQLVALLTRGLAPPGGAESAGSSGSGDGGGTVPPPVRVAYCLPSSPGVVVDVRDDTDVQLMWEEAVERPGSERLQIYWEWEQKPAAQQRQRRRRPSGKGPGSAGTSASSGSTRTTASMPDPCSSSFSSSNASLPAPTAGGHGMDAAPPPAPPGTMAPIRVIPAPEVVLHMLLSSPFSIYGQTFEGEWQGCRVAVKCLNWRQLAGQEYGDEASQRAFLASVAALAGLRHPNLVQVHGVVASSASSSADGKPLPRPARGVPVRAPALVLGWVEGPNLRSVLEQRSHPLLQTGTARLQLLREVAEGMAHLHACGLVHFHLTPECILLGSEQQRLAVRISRYELPSSKLAALQDPAVAFSPDLLPWLAPELVKGHAPITEKADVYSFGIIMWSLWAWRPPYDCIRFAILCDSMRGSGVLMRPIIPGRTSTPQPVPGWRPLMERCWAEDPAQRPSFQAIREELRVLAVQG